MTKPYQTTSTTPAPENRAPHHHTPLEMAGLWLRVVYFIGAAVMIVVLLSFPPHSLRELRNEVIAVAVFMLALYGIVLGFYTRLEHRTAYGSHPKAQRSGDTWRIHLRREIPVGDRGTVDMEPETVELPVAPREFTRIVREMMRNGTAIEKRPAGVSQPLRTKILRALEDMDGATNGGSGVGWKLPDDLDALLRDIDQW